MTGTKSVEKRRHSRRRAFLGAKISYDDNAISFDCVIRDLGEHGARIRLRPGERLPADFYLIDVPHGVAYHAESVWFNASEFGVRFLKSLDLQTSSEREAASLRRLWMACSQR